MLTYLILSLGLVIEVAAIPSPIVLPRQDTPVVPCSLPIGSQDTTERENAIKTKRETFLYGPPIIPNTSYWPTGSMGDSTIQLHGAQLAADATAVAVTVAADKILAVASFNTVCTKCVVKQLREHQLY